MSGFTHAQWLPALREDLELLHLPQLQSEGLTWRLRDPARNIYFDIGQFEFVVLSVLRTSVTMAQLQAQVSARLKQDVPQEELAPVLEFLYVNELLSAQDSSVRKRLLQKFQGSQTGWWEKLLHHYLFFRIPLINPGVMLDWLVARTHWIYTRASAYGLLLLLVVDLHLLVTHWPAVKHHFDYSFSWEGLLIMGVVGVLSKFTHEMGHALTARRYGVRVPAMGVVILLLYPILYTDTSDSWRLGNKRHRLAIVGAGMLSELALALMATACWAVCPEGVLKSAFFYLAFVNWAMALVVNMNPFMRFDGYYFLSDLMDFPNLRQRSFSLARIWIRQHLWGLWQPDPEPQLSARSKQWLIVYAFAAWLYLLALYLGVCLLIYHFAFKLLGIFLMGVELYWFVLRPLHLEMRFVLTHARECRPRWFALGCLLLLALLMSVIWIQATAVSAPGLLRARNEYLIQAPGPGFLFGVHAKEGETLAQGRHLVTIISPEVLLRGDTSQITRLALLEELQATAANAVSRERINAIQRQISSTSAAQSLSASESDLLRIRSPGEGRVRELYSASVSGHWVKSKEVLMRIVSEHDPVIHAYVSESQLQAVKMGARATFYPEDVSIAPVHGRIVEVDSMATKALPSRLLASGMGGGIAADKGPTGEWLSREARYRVRIELDQSTEVTRAVRGRVSMEGDAVHALLNFPARVLSAMLREMGF